MTFGKSSITLLLKSEISGLYVAIVCSCKVRFIADLVENPKDKFSHDMVNFLQGATFFDSVDIVLIFLVKSNLLTLVLHVLLSARRRSKKYAKIRN